MAGIPNKLSIHGISVISSNTGVSPVRPERQNRLMETVMTTTISAAELRADIESGETITLLDLRKQVDFEAEPELIPGAVKLDPAQVGDWGHTITPDQKVVIYCARGGSISQSVQQHFANHGVEVPYLEGGYAAWKNSK